MCTSIKKNQQNSLFFEEIIKILNSLEIKQVEKIKLFSNQYKSDFEQVNFFLK